MIEWICVEDALPNDRQWVLATDSEDIKIIKFLQTTDRRHKKRDGYFDEFEMEITHWMPLPELPKRNENE